MLDVQSVLGEDRAVQVVLRVVVGCERRCGGKDQEVDDMDDRLILEPYASSQAHM